MFIIYTDKLDYSRLIGRIHEKRMTQKELASKIGVSESQLSLKLRDAYQFKQTEILKICRLLDINPEAIGYYFFATEGGNSHSEIAR